MTVYILFHCNQWKEWSSMRIIGVVTKTHLKRTLRAIKKECRYSDEDMETYIYTHETTLNDLKDMNI